MRTEGEFLADYDASRFDHPSVAVDIALLTLTESRLAVLLVRRQDHPDLGKWGLPGGFVGLDESLETAAARVLRDKAGQTGMYLEQLYTFGAPERDPRTRVISIAYYGLVAQEKLRRLPDGDQNAAFARIRVPWPGETGGAVEALGLDSAPLALAFDHAEIVGMAIKRLRGKLNYTPVGFQLLPESFTLRRLQDVHEAILGRPLNKDSFRRRMLATDQLEATGTRETEVGHRPAELYRFRRRSAI